MDTFDKWFLGSLAVECLALGTLMAHGNDYAMAWSLWMLLVAISMAFIDPEAIEASRYRWLVLVLFLPIGICLVIGALAHVIVNWKKDGPEL